MTQNKENISNDIDGYKYKVFMMDPLDAGDMIADIGKVFGPSLGALASGDSNTGLLDADGDSLGKAISSFFDKVTKEKQREILSAMSKLSYVIMPDGSEPKLSSVFNAHFRGRVSSMYKWCFFAMKVQFADFFSGLETAISQLQSRVPDRE